MNDKKRERITLITGGFMIGIALLFDGLQMILSIVFGITGVGIPIAMLADWMIGFFAGICFWIWFLLCGVNFNGKKAGSLLASMALGIFLEAVPLLDALPGITFTVARTVILVRIEDALYNAEQEKMPAITKRPLRSLRWNATGARHDNNRQTEVA